MNAPKTPSTSTAVKAGRLFEKSTPSTISSSSRLNPIARIQGGGKLSWWDSAAAGITASSPDRGVRVLARGRVHAQVDMKQQKKYYDAECDRFVGNSPPRKLHLKGLSESPDVCHSPCTLLSKYGRRPFVSPRRLEPLRTPRELAATSRYQTSTSDRERANAEARQACWAAQLHAMSAATRGLVAAAAV